MAYRIILKSQKTNARANEYRYLTQKMRSRIDEMTVNGKSVYDIADTVAKEFNMDTPSAERIVSDYFDPSKKKRANDGPKEYTCQFWEPGLVSYEDSGSGKALLRKESMDKILPSFVGKPVTIDHVEGSPDEIMNAGRAVGKVTNAYWNPDTGWYECKFTVENEDARKKVESGWSVSCAFDVSEQTGPGGEHHAIPYDEEITSGTFTHLALVENPRYEDSKIFKNHKMRLNAKGVKMNKKYAVGDRVEYRGEIGTVAGYSGHIVVVDYDAGGTARVSEDNDDLKKKGDMTAFKGSKENAKYKVGDAIPAGKFFKEGGAVTKVEGNKFWITFTDGTNKKELGPFNQDQFNSKDNAKTVLISIPYRLLERDDYKNPDQELQAKGMRNVGGGGGVADFEFNGTESQAAAIVKQVLGTVSGVDIGMMNSKKNDASDFGTILREIKEQLYQMAQALAGKFNGRAGVFKKGESVRDHEGQWCTIVGEAESGEYYVVKYADGSTARMREGDLNNSKENGIPDPVFIYPSNDRIVTSDRKAKLISAGFRKDPSNNIFTKEGASVAETKALVQRVFESDAGSVNVYTLSNSKENSQKFKVTKKHLTGPLAGMTTDEITSVEFKVGEKIKSVEGTEYVVESVQRQNSGEPYSVSIEHRPEERGGDVYRVALIKDGKEADHILVKGDAAAQDQKRKWLQQYNQKQNSAGDQFQVGDNVKRAVGAVPGDPSGKIVEKRELTCKVKWDGATSLQEVQYYTDLQKAGAKNSRVILKPGKSNSTQEKKPMFGLFKRKSKKNDQAAAPAKLPLEQIDVEIDGVAVPLSELVTGYKAEQAEVAEKQKLEQAQAAKEVSEAPEAPAPEANADNTAPEDLNLDNQEFSVEDGSRFNMTELVDSYNRRKAAKMNAEADAKAKADEEAKKNEKVIKQGKLAKLVEVSGKYQVIDLASGKMLVYFDDQKMAEDAFSAVEAGDKSFGNASETPEEKAAKENAAAEEAKKKADEEAAAKAKENAKKDPKYFHKLNDLKNAGEVITGKAIETLSDKIERGNARYGSKKK